MDAVARLVWLFSYQGPGSSRFEGPRPWLKHFDNCIVIRMNNAKGSRRPRMMTTNVFLETFLLTEGELKENQCRSSYYGHTGDTLAPAAEEGRGRPRKARRSRQQAMIPGCPNGATQYVEDVLRYDESIVVSRQASELKHLSSWKRRKQK